MNFTNFFFNTIFQKIILYFFFGEIKLILYEYFKF